MTATTQTKSAKTTQANAITFNLKSAPMRTLFEMQREIADLWAIRAVLDWDQQTQMPKGANGVRGEQNATLDAIIHERKAASAFGKAIAKAEAAIAAHPERFADADRGLVRQTRREHDEATKLPEQFVRDFAIATATGWEHWQAARAAKNYGMFKDDLARIVDLMRQKAQYKNPQAAPYAVLFDEYEPGMDLATCERALEAVRKATVPLLKRVRAAQQVDASFMAGEYAHDKQMALSRQILEIIRYDFNHGRLDLAAHPFMTGLGSPDDDRITTRVDEHDVISCLMSVMHECGHAHYELGIDPALKRTIIGGGTSSGIHESQSRTWENIIGRSAAFWQAHYHVLQAAFPTPFKKVALADFVRALNRVEGSLIRVEADELTYNLHIIIRFEIEKDLIGGKIEVADLPGIWNRKYHDYLGVTVPDDGDGLMQDVHWSSGLIGYFPTYSLGNCYAAQFAAAERKAIPDTDARLARGETVFIREWQRDNIHRWGSIYQGDDLCRRVTGEGLNPQYLITYLTEKFTQVYGLK
jgi:carboxypeptidase Taq